MTTSFKIEIFATLGEEVCEPAIFGYKWTNKSKLALKSNQLKSRDTVITFRQHLSKNKFLPNLVFTAIIFYHLLLRTRIEVRAELHLLDGPFKNALPTEPHGHGSQSKCCVHLKIKHEQSVWWGADCRVSRSPFSPGPCPWRSTWMTWCSPSSSSCWSRSRSKCPSAAKSKKLGHFRLRRNRD